MATTVEYFYYASISIGFILLLVFVILNSIVPDDQPKKYGSSDFLTNVSLPNLFAIILLAIGYIGLQGVSYDERSAAALSYIVALVASAVALSSIMLSISRIRWAAD